MDWGYNLESIKDLTSGEDYGLYQVYGAHPIYGADTLLYIGKASKQTLAKRVLQGDRWICNQDSENIKVYVGHFGGNQPISVDAWEEQIDLAEKLLIYTHKPALNSSNVSSVPDLPIEMHVFNWGDFRELLPEVSAFRYLAEDDKHFSTFESFNMGNNGDE